jgi:hypothetical protein
MIELVGLSTRQVELLEVLWDLDSVNEVQDFLSTLDENDQLECQTLMELLRLELMDESINLLFSYKEANEVLSKFTLGK